MKSLCIQTYVPDESDDTKATDLSYCLALFLIWAVNIDALPEPSDSFSIEHRLREAQKLQSRFY